MGPEETWRGHPWCPETKPSRAEGDGDEERDWISRRHHIPVSETWP